MVWKGWYGKRVPRKHRKERWGPDAVAMVVVVVVVVVAVVGSSSSSSRNSNSSEPSTMPNDVTNAYYKPTAITVKNETLLSGDAEG